MPTGNINITQKNKYDKACFQHYIAYGKSKDFVKRTQSGKVLKKNVFKIASDPKYDGYQRGLGLMVYNFFDKKSALLNKYSGSGTINKPDYQLANELHKPIIKKFRKRKVFSSFRDDIWPEHISQELRPHFTTRNELSIENNIIIRGLRVVIPSCDYHKIIFELHKNHPGMSRMISLSRLHIWFLNIDKEIERLVKTSETYEKLSNTPNKSLPHPLDWPVQPMDCVHIDLFEFENNFFGNGGQLQ